MEYCIEEIKTDCEELLSTFQQTESVRFETFSKIWKEMRFSEIFLGTIEGKETRAFSREILAIACTFFLPPFTFQIRTGALYLLYGLYNSQLAQPPEKIRLSLKHWDDLKKFEQDAANAQHFDAVYILRKLISEKAIKFTAMPRPLAFRAKKKNGREMVCEDFVDRGGRIQELVSTDMLEELTNVHSHYEKLKTDVVVGANEPGSSVALVQQNLVPRLHNAVTAFVRWKDIREDKVESVSEEGPPTDQECSRRAQLLASIKSKSYGQTVEASKGRRHRQVELQPTWNEAGPVEKTKRRKSKKPSLKQKRARELEVKGVTKKDSAEFTNVWQLSVPGFVDLKPRKIKRFKW